MHCPLAYPGIEADIEMSCSFSLDSSNRKKKSDPEMGFRNFLNKSSIK